MDSSQKGKNGPDENNRPEAQEQADRQELLSRRDALIRAGWSAPLIVAAVGSAGGVSPATYHLDEHCNTSAIGHCNEQEYGDAHANDHGDEHVNFGVGEEHVDLHANDHADEHANVDGHCNTDFYQECNVYGDVWGP
ncbi:MAG: hypothetical protein ACYTFA_03025 [Planctomycetota bacterium]|jgi:hypothetical protein